MGRDCLSRMCAFRRRAFTLAIVLLAVAALQPLPAAEAILVGAGDIAKCGKRLEDAEATARVLDRLFVELNAATCDGASLVDDAAVFTVGDNVYKNGTAEEFRECYDPTWGRHRERTRPAIGNHDYDGRNAEPYFDYFGEAAGERGKGYYSYNLGDWHIVVLNSACKKVGGCDEGSEQYRWLLQDLQENPNRCAAAYFHHPLFTSGKHGPQKNMKSLYQVLYDHGVELVLAGHDHNYERFAPQTPDGKLDRERGIRQFVVGMGGREHRKIRRAAPNSEVRDRSSYGVLKLTLKPDRYDWEFLPVDGAVFQDAGTGMCH